MLKKLNKNTAGITKSYPEKILQFGGGNFLRAFVGQMIDILNEKANFNGNIVIVKPTKRGDYKKLRQQDGLFHVLTKGFQSDTIINNNRLIKSISRIIHPYLEWDLFLEFKPSSAKDKMLKGK